MPLDVGEKEFSDVQHVILGDDQLDDFAKQLLADIDKQSTRKLIAIAGIPGSGKTTLMLKLIDRINAIKPATAAAVSMDAYHLMNVQLDALDLRKVKGSPQTYDVTSYLHLLKQLKTQTKRDVLRRRLRHWQHVHKEEAHRQALLQEATAQWRHRTLAEGWKGWVAAVAASAL